MKTGMSTRLAMVAVAVLAGTALLSADRLILRNGERIDGELVSVRNGVIEFREYRGPRDSRVIQVPREEVERIDLDERRVDDRPYGRPDDRSETRPRPSGLREREIWVPATTAWTDTGVDVRPGQNVYLDTHGGDIQWQRGSHARAGGDESARYDPNRPIPSRPIGALIAKIGADSRDYFFVGDDQGPVRMRESGRLFLGINDSNLRDNQGAFRVTIYY